MVGIDEFELRERQRLARKKFIHLFEMVGIDVQIPEGVDEIAHFQAANVGNKVR